jgi:hypothetical protein
MDIEIHLKSIDWQKLNIIRQQGRINIVDVKQNKKRKGTRREKITK